jgi:uncharacterized protein YdaU (DUF1376 family)
MHYYQFNISDYRSATVHLSNDEDLAYRRLLDMYYDSENKIPLDTHWVARRLRLDTATVENVLNDMFVKHEDGWFNARCQDVIQQYHAMAEKNRANGRLGGRKKNPTANPMGNDSQPIVKATINQELETINKDKKNKRGSRLALDFCLTKEWEQFCVEQRPELNAQKTFDQFKDYWVSQPKGTKLDWFATWRNWVRSTNAPKQNHVDIARVTVPMDNRPDPALEKIKEDSLRAVPPSLEVLAKMAALRKVNI